MSLLPPLTRLCVCAALDEAISHLDIACGGEINAALKAASFTRIIVAHRQETID